MKVLYDHQTFELQSFGGISRYFVELLRSDAGFEVELALKRSSNRHLRTGQPWCPELKPIQDAFERLSTGWEIRGLGRAHRFLRMLGVVDDPKAENLENSLRRIQDGEFDVFHPTYYDPYFLEVIGAKPFVLTIHDMIFEIFPEYFPAENPISRHKRLLCSRASRIIAVSASTKEDLIRSFGIDPAKIDVVHHGSSIRSEAGRPDRLGPTPDRYMLFVGNRAIYKNFGFFLTSISDILHDQRELFLVCVGPKLTVEEQTLFSRLDVREQVVHFDVDDRQLENLYRNAELFAFPSLYEGFGIPILEAFSCGCPVVASDIGVFHEVAAEAAAFFDPEDGESIQQTVRSVLEDPDLRHDLVTRGATRVRRFSWAVAAQKTHDTYRRAAGRVEGGPGR